MATMTFEIDDLKYPEFLEAFLLCQPVPLDPDTGEPTMTDNQWVKEWGRLQYWSTYRLGRKRKRDQEHSEDADPEIIV